MYEVAIYNGETRTLIHSNTVAFFHDKVIGGTIRQGINCIDSFSFSILPSNEGYNLLYPLKTIIQVYNNITKKIEFRGRVLIAVENINEIGLMYKEVTCESELAYLLDSTQMFMEFTNKSLMDFITQLVTHHNNQVEEYKRFEIGNITVTDLAEEIKYRYIDYISTWDNFNDKLLSRLGGEIKIRYENEVKYLDYQPSFGVKKDNPIRIAKNIQMIQREKDPTQVISRLIPLGKKNSSNDGRLNITSVNDGRGFIDDPLAISEFGIIEKSMVWDDITDASVLKAKGESFLSSNNKIKKKHKVTAWDLALIGETINSYQVYNTYFLDNPLMGIEEDVRVIEKVIKFDSPQLSEIVLGDKFQNIKSYQSQNVKNTNGLNTVRENLTLTIDNVYSMNSELTKTVDIVDELHENEFIKFECIDGNLVMTRRNGEVVTVPLEKATPFSLEPTTMSLEGVETTTIVLEEIKENLQTISFELEKIKNFNRR